MTDIPSHLFVSNPKWHCKTDADLFKLFNQKFPLPKQQSWTVFRPSNDIFMKVLSVLRMKATTMEGWRRLPKVGRLIGKIGVATSDLWEWTLHYRTPTSKKANNSSLASEASTGLGTTVEENRFRVGQFLAHSRPLEQQSLWPEI